MEIQWSLVLFTALSGAGAWLVACAGLDAFKGLAKKTVVPAVVTGIVLIIVGGIANDSDPYGRYCMSKMEYLRTYYGDCFWVRVAAGTHH